MAVIGQFHALVALSACIEHGYQLDRKLGGPRTTINFHSEGTRFIFDRDDLK